MLDINNVKRIEKIKQSQGYYRVYVFDCINCKINEIRSSKTYLKSHSGKCIYCTHKGTPFKSSFNHLKDSVARTNQKRKKFKEFGLTFEDFLEFVKIKNCHYCNSPIQWVEHTGKGQHKYNLDRKDSNLGYIKTNLVVCCWRCNQMKGSQFSYEEFKAVVNLLNSMRNGSFKWRENGS
jgi:hypothetical protein